MGRTSGWHASWDGFGRVSGQRSDICDADRGGFQGHKGADRAGGAPLSRLSLRIGIIITDPCST